ncbi:MAG: hypothetical protein GWN00_33880, partial [Aliifodinibius sp.]|nr:hypothetical protein [candidate division Zixibacteria bacterium]NIT61017.1 hypothetical protein [Fodinibius sp.]NIV15743.1 hypothetical protein [Fodinibius sp.]NIY29598.1 hypothetical protein [Fodinibius sp.]
NEFLKSDAIEFVENLISWEIRKLLIPILESYQTNKLPDNSFSSAIQDTEDVLIFLKEICHPEIERKLKPNIEYKTEMEQPIKMAETMQKIGVK